MPEKIEDMQYNPAFSAVYKDEEQDKKEFEAWYAEVFQKIPLESRLAISGDEAVYETKKLCRAFGISDWQKVGYASRIIRDWFIGKIGKKGAGEMAIEKIELAQERAEKFVNAIERSLKTIKESGQAEYDKMIEKIKLEEALDKYQELKEMIITESSIKTEGVDYLLPGNLENWLGDYFQAIGGQKHSNFERNQYFLDSENIKKTSSEEKDKLATIFKVYDEEGFVAVDKEDRSINFEETKRVNPGIFNLDDIMSFYDEKEGSAAGSGQASAKKTTPASSREEGRSKADNFGNIKKIDSKPFFKSDDGAETWSAKKNLIYKKNNQKEASSGKSKETGKTKKDFNTIDLKDYS